MSELDKMLNGEHFDGASAEVEALRHQAGRLKLAINQSLDDTERHALQRELFGYLGEQSRVQPPFHCEFGKTIRIGEHTFINMNVVMLDGAPITIGNNVLIGPVLNSTPLHILWITAVDKLGETICKPIVVEDDVWIGGNVVINQGVTIGARSVVAANSVVNHDVPPDTLVGGTPARVLRSLLDSIKQAEV